MVHFPPFASSNLCIQLVIPGFCPGGFPHSEISGSTPVCGSPKLIAACHVLHRLFLPRHPPCALSSLTIEFTPTQLRINLNHTREASVDLCVCVLRPLSPVQHSAVCPRQPGEYFSCLYEYSKDTQQLTAYVVTNQRPTWRAQCAAQPCSYIYPIYSVVKNRRAGSYCYVVC